MNMHLMDCLPLKTKSEENSSSISSCTQKIGVVWMTINGAISHPTIAFSETRKWSDYPPTKHTDNRSLMQKREKYSCASAPLSSAERLKVNIWKYEASIYVCVCVSLSICLSPCMLPNDKTGTQSSRWAYSHLRTLWWGSRFGSGRAGGLIRSLGNNKNLSCTKDSTEREKELSFRDKTAASVFSVCSVQLRPMHCGKFKINRNTQFS